MQSKDVEKRYIHSTVQQQMLSQKYNICIRLVHSTHRRILRTPYLEHRSMYQHNSPTNLKMCMYYQQLTTLFYQCLCATRFCVFCTPSSRPFLHAMFPVYHKHFTIHLDLVSCQLLVINIHRKMTHGKSDIKTL